MCVPLIGYSSTTKIFLDDVWPEIMYTGLPRCFFNNLVTAMFAFPFEAGALTRTMKWSSEIASTLSFFDFGFTSTVIRIE